MSIFAVTFLSFCKIAFSFENNRDEADYVTQYVNEAVSVSKVFWQKEIREVKINYFFEEGKQPLFESNEKSGVCRIDLTYDKNNYRPLLMKSIREDVYFSVFHEISHCVAGWQVIKDKKIDWLAKQLNLGESDIYNLDRKMEKIFYISSLKCVECNDYFPNPFVVYHEIFADTLASLWWISLGFDEYGLVELLEFRKNNIRKNISYFSQNVLELLLQERKNIHNVDNVFFAKLLAQKELINYIGVFDVF